MVEAGGEGRSQKLARAAWEGGRERSSALEPPKAWEVTEQGERVLPALGPSSGRGSRQELRGGMEGQDGQPRTPNLMPDPDSWEGLVFPACNSPTFPLFHP